MFPTEGVKPVLNRPVVLNEEGTLPTTDPEKTVFAISSLQLDWRGVW